VFNGLGGTAVSCVTCRYGPRGSSPAPDGHSRRAPERLHVPQWHRTKRPPNPSNRGQKYGPSARRASSRAPPHPDTPHNAIILIGHHPRVPGAYRTGWAELPCPVCHPARRALAAARLLVVVIAGGCLRGPTHPMDTGQRSSPTRPPGSEMGGPSARRASVTRHPHTLVPARCSHIHIKFIARESLALIGRVGGTAVSCVIRRYGPSRQPACSWWS
jgi:hypothetical protein